MRRASLGCLLLLSSIFPLARSCRGGSICRSQRSSGWRTRRCCRQRYGIRGHSRRSSVAKGPCPLFSGVSARTHDRNRGAARGESVGSWSASRCAHVHSKRQFFSDPCPVGNLSSSPRPFLRVLPNHARAGRCSSAWRSRWPHSARLFEAVRHPDHWATHPHCWRSLPCRGQGTMATPLLNREMLLF